MRRPAPFVLAALLALLSVYGFADTPVDPSEIGVQLLDLEDGVALPPTPQPRLYLTQSGLQFGWKASDPRMVQLRTTQELATWLGDLAKDAPVFLAVDSHAHWETVLPLVEGVRAHPIQWLARLNDDMLGVAAELPHEPAAAGATEVRVGIRTDDGESVTYAIGKRDIATEEALNDDLATVHEVLPGAAIVLCVEETVPAGAVLQAVRDLQKSGFACLRFANADPRPRPATEPRESATAGREEPGAQNAIQTGLRWLARHQDKDGSWSPEASTLHCNDDTCSGSGHPENRTGDTGLAILSFLGAGYSSRGEHVVDGISYGDVVEKALEWLVAHQDEDGLITEKPCTKLTYNHAIATLALCEAVGMKASPRYQEPARHAADWLARAQNPGAGWRYTARAGDNDMSVTAWCVLALKSAQVAGYAVPETVLSGALEYVKSMTDESGRVGYVRREDVGAKVVIMGKNENHANHPTTTAIGMLIRDLVGPDTRDPVLPEGAIHLCTDLPAWSDDHLSTDYYYWYFGSLALYLQDGPDTDGAHKWWKRWTPALSEALLRHQESGNSCCAGSWSPTDRWGSEGGRVYATALNVLSLEIYGQYASAIPGKRK